MATEVEVGGADPDLVAALDDALAEARCGECTLALTERVTGPTLAALLALSGVRSVVLAEPDAALEAASGGRAGAVTSDRFEWRAPPGGVAREIVFVGSSGHAGVRFLRHAIRLGVRSIVFLYPGCTPARRSVWPLLVKRLLLSLGRRFFGEFRPTHGVAGVLHRVFERRYRRAFDRLLDAFRIPLLPSAAFATERVLVIVGSLGPGGAERQVVHTVMGLRAAGVDVRLLCERLGGAENRFHLWRLEGSGVPVEERRVFADVATTRVPAEAAKRLARLGDSLDEATRWVAPEVLWWAREIVERRPGVVHVWLDATNVKAGLAAAIAGVPRIVLSGRSMAPVHFDLIQPFMRPGYQALLRRPEVVLLNNSEAGADDYARWLHVPRARVGVVHNAAPATPRPPIDAIAAARRTLGVPDGAPLVGTLMRFSEEKQPLLFVRAAAEVARLRPGAWFVMLGDGPLREAARALGRDLGLAERLLLPGPVRDPAPVLAGLDVFALTSRLEGLPNVVIEAQALGVPVVTTDAGGAREAIDPERSGYAVSPHDPKLLAERISAILGDPEWAAAARQHAPAFVAARFGVERMIAETRQVYRGHLPREGSG